MPQSTGRFAPEMFKDKNRSIPLLSSSGSVSVARAYPDVDARNYRNMPFIRAHFEIDQCSRHLKADLGVIPSSDANTALIADTQSLQTDPVGDRWEIPQGEGYTKFERFRRRSHLLLAVGFYFEDHQVPMFVAKKCGQRASNISDLERNTAPPENN
jgi:hypothetical protein